MKKSWIISFVLILLCDSLSAQNYRVFSLKGTVEIFSDYGWQTIIKGDKVEQETTLRLTNGSKVELIDSRNKIYMYDSPGELTVKQLVNKRKNFLESLTLNATRTSIGGVAREIDKSKEPPVTFELVDKATEHVLSAKRIKSNRELCYYFRILNPSDKPIFCDIVITYPDGTMESYLSNFFRVGASEYVDFPELTMNLPEGDKYTYTLYVSGEYIELGPFMETLGEKTEVFREIYPDVRIVE